MNSSSNPMFDFEVRNKGIINNQLFLALSVSCQLTEIFFCFLGIATNLINLRVFVEQGATSSSTNIGLFSLSLFDFFHCLFMALSKYCFIFSFLDDRATKAKCIAVSSYPAFISVVFYYCSNWTTVYLSIERALCVVLPLKVKLIMRPKVTKVVITSMFLFFLALQMTYSTSTRVVWNIDPITNQSLPSVGMTAFSMVYLYYYSLFANTILSSIALLIVGITTTIMILKLKAVRKWRQSNAGTTVASSDNDNKVNDVASEKKNLSSKDIEMVKSVTTVTSIFLVCLMIGHVPATVILTVPGLTSSLINRNLLDLCYQFRFLFSLINSSINYFFYIRVSSRYKAAFVTALPKCAALTIPVENK